MYELKERREQRGEKGETERDRKRQHSFVHLLLKWLQQSGLGESKAGSKNPIWVSHVNGRNLHIWVIFQCVPMCKGKQLD